MARSRWEDQVDDTGATRDHEADHPWRSGTKQKGAIVFVELNSRQNDGYLVMLEWDSDTGATQIVVADVGAATQLVFAVPAAVAGDAFRHPFRYTP